MRKIIFLLLITNCTLHFTNAQTQWQRTFMWGNAYSIKQTTDGGYVTAGYTNASNFDMYIVKLDNNGVPQWNRTVGGGSFDHGLSVIQTTDGGYAMAGYTSSFGAGNYDYYIVKLNAGGTLQWSKTIGGAFQDYSRSFIQTTDGGYVLVGNTYSFGSLMEMYVVKLDAGGTLEWSRNIGGWNWDEGYSVVQTADGGIALAGYTNSFGAGGNDFYIVKLSSSGTLQWSRTVGGPDSEKAYSIILTSDGGFALAGYTKSFGAGSNDFYIVKLSSNGTLQWSRTAGGTSVDFAYSIIQTTDGGYAVAGSTHSFGSGSTDFYIVRLDGSGVIQWSKTTAIGVTPYEEARSIIQTTDGGYAVAGWSDESSNAYFIAKFNSSGNTCGSYTSPVSSSGSGGTSGNPNTSVTTPTPTVTSPTSTVVTLNWLTSLICPVGIQSISNETPASYELYQNYPNPFNPVTKIRFDISGNSSTQTFISVYDILGREVTILVNEQLQPGTYEAKWDASKEPSGIYYCKLSSGDYSQIRIMVLLK